MSMALRLFLPAFFYTVNKKRFWLSFTTSWFKISIFGLSKINFDWSPFIEASCCRAWLVWDHFKDLLGQFWFICSALAEYFAVPGTLKALWWQICFQLIPQSCYVLDCSTELLKKVAKEKIFWNAIFAFSCNVRRVKKYTLCEESENQGSTVSYTQFVVSLRRGCFKLKSKTSCFFIILLKVFGIRKYVSRWFVGTDLHAFIFFRRVNPFFTRCAFRCTYNSSNMRCLKDCIFLIYKAQKTVQKVLLISSSRDF